MSHPDFQEWIKSNQPKKFVLLYHWDYDGIACAAQFIDFIEQASPETEIVHMLPTINNYFLTDKEFQQIKDMQCDGLLTTDINFGADVIDRLEDIVPQLFVFDHHAQTADIDKPGMQDQSYPGCSMMVSDYLSRPMSLVGVLGMVGDQEDRIVEYTDFYPMVEQMMQEHDLSFDQMQRITKLIDTMYMVGDQDGFQYAIELLRANPLNALTDERLLENDRRIEEAMKKWAAHEMDAVGDQILSMSIDSQMSLISEVTRAKAKANPDTLIVTDQVWGEDASFYVRRRNVDIDLGCVVDLARSKGFNAGGKPEVAGVVLPASEVDALRAEVIELLKSKIS
jgi:nanoRNase/pAp phosphatase (c-di-AMP/oligoRNAs hydrolase)